MRFKIYFSTARDLQIYFKFLRTPVCINFRLVAIFIIISYKYESTYQPLPRLFQLLPSINFLTTYPAHLSLCDFRIWTQLCRITILIRHSSCSLLYPSCTHSYFDPHNILFWNIIFNTPTIGYEFLYETSNGKLQVVSCNLDSDY